MLVGVSCAVWSIVRSERFVSCSVFCFHIRLLLFLELVSCTRFSFVFVQKEYVFLSDLRISYDIFWDEHFQRKDLSRKFQFITF